MVIKRRVAIYFLATCRILCICALYLSAAFANAQVDLKEPEVRVQAAFLFKFGGYIEWPAEAFSSPKETLVVGVINADALAEELSSLVVGREIEGRSVVVRKLRRGDSLIGVHLLFVGRLERGDLERTLIPLRGIPILIVTESSDALKFGSIINLVVVDGKLRFDVSPEVAAANGLKISSKLLAVARKVVEAP